MVCIAAFIILAINSVFVAFLSIFRRDLGKKYWTIFKKAWSCVWTRVRLKKCETNFKDDVKNSILKKFVLKKPKLVKPISVGIEVLSVLIVFISVWSLVEGAKAGLGLVVLGTCNVSAPSSCSLGTEACTVDKGQPQNLLEATERWFAEWGEIFAGIPDSFKNWQVKDYLVIEMPLITKAYRNAPLALDIIDPLCSSCMQTFKNQESSGFFREHNVYFMFYPIMLDENTPKFKNSDLIVRYLHSATIHDNMQNISAENSTAIKIITKLFTEYNSEKVNYQSYFINEADSETAEKLLQNWLLDFGKTEQDIAKIKQLTTSQKVTDYMRAVKDVVEYKIKARGIPTLIYNNKKHFGLYRKQ